MVHDRIVRTLTEQGAGFTIHEHAPMRSVEQHQAHLPFDPDHFLKTLAFRVQGSSWVLVAPKRQDRLDYRKLTNALGVPRSALVAAPPTEIESSLGCEVGGVSLMATRAGVVLLVDSAAACLSRVYTGSGRADRTLEVAMADLLALTQPRIVPLRREEAAAPAD